MVQFRVKAPGMTVASVSNAFCVAEISLYGGQVLSFRPKGRTEVLFLSVESSFERGKAIRGGIPVCWPWFGPHPENPALPQHGLLRLTTWILAEVRETDDHTAITLECLSTPETRALWPHDFKVSLAIIAGKDLTLRLTSTNTGTAPFTVTDALHTYLAVADIGAVSVSGLENVRYTDTADRAAEKTQSGALRVTGETDRVYHGEEACILYDSAASRTITVEKKRFPDTIVWNPWIERSRALKDFGDLDYKKMLCIESGAAAGHRIRLDPSMSITQELKIRIGC